MKHGVYRDGVVLSMFQCLKACFSFVRLCVFFGTVQMHRMLAHKFTALEHYNHDADEYIMYRIDYLSILTATFKGDLG